MRISDWSSDVCSSDLLDPAARTALIHVEDAAREIVAQAESPAPDAVCLSDARPEGYEWREIMQTAAEAFGRRPRRVRVPPDRKSVVSGTRVSVRCDLGGRRYLKNKTTIGQTSQ